MTQTKLTKVYVLSEAKKFKSKAEWKANSRSTYKTSLEKGWHDEATAHMETIKVQWNLELLSKSASKYLTRGKWKESEPSAYKSALRAGLLDKVCNHMIQGKMPNGTLDMASP